MSDPLDTVLRIRRLAMDDAARTLASCLHSEETARQAAEAAEAAIGAEGEVAADLSAGDGAVEAFARWLPVGRARAAAARVRHDTATAETARARASLTIARAATEAASALSERRAAERDLLTQRRAQAVLDEVGSRISTDSPVAGPFRGREDR